MGWVPTPEVMRARVEKTLPRLKNFYMTGQWAMPTGGVQPSLYSGRHGIQLICQHEGKHFKTICPQFSFKRVFRGEIYEGERNLELISATRLQLNKDQISFDLSAESPPIGSAVQSGVLLNFTANEEPFVVYVQWDDCNETTGWENVTTPTGEGNNTLSVRIADEAGWWTTQTFWWTIDNNPPPISITPNWTDLSSKPWRNGTMIDVYTENGTLQYSWDQGSNRSVEYPNRDELHLTISLSDGSHELCIYVIDSAGNVNVTQSVVLVDSTPISFEFPEPRNGSSHNSAVWITIVFSESLDQLNITWLGTDLAGEWITDTELKVKLAKKNVWHELEVAVKDEACNLTLKTLRVKMLDDPAPLYLDIHKCPQIG